MSSVMPNNVETEHPPSFGKRANNNIHKKSDLTIAFFNPSNRCRNSNRFRILDEVQKVSLQFASSATPYPPP